MYYSLILKRSCENFPSLTKERVRGGGEESNRRYTWRTEGARRGSGVTCAFLGSGSRKTEADAIFSGI